MQGDPQRQLSSAQMEFLKHVDKTSEPTSESAPFVSAFHRLRERESLLVSESARQE